MGGGGRGEVAPLFCQAGRQGVGRGRQAGRWGWEGREGNMVNVPVQVPSDLRSPPVQTNCPKLSCPGQMSNSVGKKKKGR